MIAFVYYVLNAIKVVSKIDSPDWIKSKKVSIHLINKKDNKCFKYDITVTLNNEEIKKDPQKKTFYE